ncbi:hypothetical protein H490_0105025 [Leucobacter sp. UCD-THU]|jgi:hypothetical protein|uniref:hypothetical protein n=1 Tax=Leucobacter sp. UCD-THU TaxID=1292023 RepID=UPI000381651C|nr:hypothetical protein [Leucobacter sp. UCD-THU]EYT56069.1 hypothetical protein H490_0105025 [Leucobacter sp. UCD-THU]
MNHEPAGPAGPPRRRWALTATIAAALAVAAGGIWLSTAGAEQPDGSASPVDGTERETEGTASPTEAPASSETPNSPETAGGSGDAGSITEDTASELIAAAISAPLTRSGDDGALAKQIEGFAAGAYAAELEAQWQELVVNGWSISGAPEIVKTSVETAADERSAVAVSCVDATAVRMLDSAGVPIGADAASTNRALHRFTLTRGDDDVWRVTNHDFPDDPAC